MAFHFWWNDDAACHVLRSIAGHFTPATTSVRGGIVVLALCRCGGAAVHPGLLDDLNLREANQQAAQAAAPESNKKPPDMRLFIEASDQRSPLCGMTPK